jgi:chromosome partitioning protein
MVATAPEVKDGRTRASAAHRRIIEAWEGLPSEYSEPNLEMNLGVPMLKELGFAGPQIQSKPNIALPSTPGLAPDLLIYQDLNQPPVLVVENKKRDSTLAAKSDAEFVAACQQNVLYRKAVSYVPGDNGVRQYLDKDKVKPECLASYGLVFNGDFFQLWRRVDGLVFPLTAIQRVTKASIPGLMQQLAYCLQNPQPALVGTIWNRKGGVAKTTNTVNIGATLALDGKKVLLIDLDPQGDLTRSLGLTAQNLPNYLKPCIDKLELREPAAAKAIVESVIQPKTFPTTDGQKYELAILTTESVYLERFRDREHEFANLTLSPAAIVKQLIQQLQATYDYILIDVPPSPGRLSEAALYSADVVLIPSDLSRKSLHQAVHISNHTLPEMRAIRAKQSRLHLGPWNLGIAFSNCPADAGGLETAAQKFLKDEGFTAKQCQKRLQPYAQIKTVEFKGAPVVCWQNAPITKQFRALTDEVFLSHNFTDC